MNISFSLLCSPTGCARSGHLGTPQYTSDSYVRTSPTPSAVSVLRLKKRVMDESFGSPLLRAAAEMHIATYPGCRYVSETRRDGIETRINKLLGALRDERLREEV